MVEWIRIQVARAYKWADMPLAVLIFAVAWFVSTNFLTIGQHERADAAIKQYVDSSVSWQKETLNYIKEKVDVIDQRLFELTKKGK